MKNPESSDWNLESSTWNPQSKSWIPLQGATGTKTSQDNTRHGMNYSKTPPIRTWVLRTC